MLNIHHHESQPSRVTVAFEHSAVSFMMSKDATFEDLTDRLDRLGNRRHGKPVAIAVKLAYPSAPSDADTFAAFLITGSMFLQPAHAQSVPQGSYRTSCTDIRVEDRTLTAVCRIAVLPYCRIAGNRGHPSPMSIAASAISGTTMARVHAITAADGAQPSGSQVRTFLASAKWARRCRRLANPPLWSSPWVSHDFSAAALARSGGQTAQGSGRAEIGVAHLPRHHRTAAPFCRRTRGVGSSGTIHSRPPS